MRASTFSAFVACALVTTGAASIARREIVAADHAVGQPQGGERLADAAARLTIRRGALGEYLRVHRGGHGHVGRRGS
ncbi:MAG: hypothetical protein U0R65_07825 [Candidatus Nanopelagicales bacterium]